MFGGGYVYTSELASLGRHLEKQREEMFGANSKERQQEEQKTADYRLKDSEDKFSKTSHSVEAQLTQQVVGLVSKEEYGRRRRELEEGPAAAEAEVAVKPKKKKKGKEKAGALSFAMDEGEDGVEAEAALPKKPKKNPTVAFVLHRYFLTQAPTQTLALSPSPSPSPNSP
jgi:hypothetical protein